jgi:hypothetical protein
MATNYYLAHQTSITAQSANGSDVSAGSYSGGTQTEIDNSAGGNGKGAPWFGCWLELSSVPSANTGIEVHAVEPLDNTKYPATYHYKLTGSIDSGESSGNQVWIGHLALSRYAKLKWKPTDSAMDGSLIIAPVLGESA